MGDALLSRMEEEFVAKSGAMVSRMTVAAAQGSLAELSHELETLQDCKLHVYELQATRGK